MKVTDFDYPLDESLIAQTPILERDSSRLMLVAKKNGFYKHEIFKNIINAIAMKEYIIKFIRVNWYKISFFL